MFSLMFGWTRFVGKASPLLAVFLLGAFVPSILSASPTRVAVVGNTPDKMIDDLLTVATVRLSDDADLQVLDRENVAKILAEQKLTLAGWVDPKQAVRVGKLLNVELFAVISAAADVDASPDLVVFSVQTGAKLLDAPIAGKTLDKRAESLVAALHKARLKFQANPKRMKTVSLLTVRNADLPRSFDPLVQAAGRWLERELLRSPDLTVLERTQTRRLSDERKLPTADPLPDLWTSLRLVELEIGQAEGNKLRGTARVTGSEGTTLSLVSVTVAAADPLAIAEALARKLAVEFEAGPAVSGLDRHEEAYRFYHESQLFWQHKEFDRALIAVEAAHALAPQDSRILRWLAWMAGTAATEKIDPGRSNSGGRPKHTVSSEALAASLPLGQRGLEVLDELFIQKAGDPSWPQLSDDTPHAFLRTYLGKIVLLPDLSEVQQREVDTLLADYRSFVNNTVWPACRDAGDGSVAYRHASSTLSGWIVIDQFSTFSVRRNDWSADFAEMLREWAGIAERRLQHEDPLELRVADYLLGNLRHQQQHTPLTPADYKALSGAYEDLSVKMSPLLRLRGIWLKVSLDQLAISQPELRGLAPSPQEVTAQSKALRQEAQSLIVAAETSPTLRSIWIDLVYGSFQQMPAEARIKASQDFCEFLLANAIYHERTFDQCLARIANSGSEGQQAALAIMQKALDLLQRPADDLTDEQRAQASHTLEERQAALLAKLTPPPQRSAPWESVRTIVDLTTARSEYLALMRPAIADEQVVTLALKLPKVYDLDRPARAEFSLLRFPLAGGSRESGGVFIVNDLPVRELAERSTQAGAEFVTHSLVLCDDYLAATSGKGILRFSLSDKSVHVINAKQGLPSDYAQYLASDGRRIYAWLGKPRAESYFVSCLPDGSELQVIASSRRTVKASPLDDATPSVCKWMTWDAARNRVVLFLVASSGSHGSLWQFTPETNALKEIAKLGLTFSSQPPRQIDANHLMMFDRTRFTTAPHAENVVTVFDLRDDTLRNVYRRDYKLSRLGIPFTMIDDAIWQSAPWGGLNSEDDSVTPFPPLRTVEKERDFQPGAVCLPIDKKQLLIGDNSGLWLLKLKQPSPP